MRIVLVAPEIPQNTGSIGRLCVATGSTLHLVDPLGFTIDDRHLRRAGLDYWRHVDVQRHPDWATFEARRPPGRLLGFSARAARSYTTVRFRDDDFLVFGAESRGLPPAIRDAHEIGRASWRERVSVAGGAASLTKNTTQEPRVV